jgi:hypothetical protein
MVVGPIAELTEEACSGPSCALLRHRRGATNETSVLLGSRASSPPAAALKMQCGDQARAGVRDPWERYKIILNQRGQLVKIGTITVRRRSRPPAHSSKPRKLLQRVVTLTHAGDFAASSVSTYLGRSVRDQLRHVRNLPNSGFRSTTESPNQGLTPWEGQRRVSQESHQTLSLCVPVNSLRPMSFATSACTVSFVGVWALIAVFTIGTSIR